MQKVQPTQTQTQNTTATDALQIQLNRWNNGESVFISDIARATNQPYRDAWKKFYDAANGRMEGKR